MTSDKEEISGSWFPPVQNDRYRITVRLESGGVLILEVTQESPHCVGDRVLLSTIVCIGCSEPMSASPFFHESAELRDGTPVCLRRIRPDDKERLKAAFERLSAQTVYHRFLHAVRELTSDNLRQLTELDFRDHVGLVVTVEEEAGERIIALGRFVRAGPDADRAEIAFTVADEYQSRGAATLLLRRLLVFAREQGIRVLVANMLADNTAMLDVFRQCGIPMRETVEDGVRRVELAVDDAP